MSQQIEGPVHLGKNDSDSFGSRVDRIIELFIRFRPQWLKNDPRGNYLALKAVATVALNLLWLVVIPAVAFEVYRGGIPGLGEKLSRIIELSTRDVVQSLVALAGAIAVVFWNLGTEFNRKWSYCCKLFNELTSMKGNELTQKNLRCCLAMDLLKCDLWAHASFHDLFAKELEFAIDHHFDSAPTFDGLSKKDVIRYIKKKKLTEQQADRLLSGHQSELAKLARDTLPEPTPEVLVKYIETMKKLQFETSKLLEHLNQKDGSNPFSRVSGEPGSRDD